jgi:hypothetical protein
VPQNGRGITHDKQHFNRDLLRRRQDTTSLMEGALGLRTRWNIPLQEKAMSNVNAKMICRRAWLLAVMLGAGTSGVFAATSAEILEKAQLRGGIACVIGAEQVDTAIGLAKEGGFVVHVLDSDATRVADAKHRLAGAGLLGRQVYVDALTGETLPYADNLVDLLVDTGALVTEAEVFRVLAPVRGKALLGEQVVARPALAHV